MLTPYICGFTVFINFGIIAIIFSEKFLVLLLFSSLGSLTTYIFGCLKLSHSLQILFIYFSVFFLCFIAVNFYLLCLLFHYSYFYAMSNMLLITYSAFFSSDILHFWCFWITLLMRLTVTISLTTPLPAISLFCFFLLLWHHHHFMSSQYLNLNMRIWAFSLSSLTYQNPALSFTQHLYFRVEELGRRKQKLGS